NLYTVSSGMAPSYAPAVVSSATTQGPPAFQPVYQYESTSSGYATGVPMLSSRAGPPLRDDAALQQQQQYVATRPGDGRASLPPSGTVYESSTQPPGPQTPPPGATVHHYVVNPDGSVMYI